MNEPQQREAWFRRTLLWGSTAIHWKGVVVILVGVAGFVGGAGLAVQVHLPVIGVPICLTAFVWTFVMAERHMENR